MPKHPRFLLYVYNLFGSHIADDIVDNFFQKVAALFNSLIASGLGLGGDVLDNGLSHAVSGLGVVAVSTSGETKHTGNCKCKKYFLHHF